MPFIKLIDVNKVYDDDVRAVVDFNLEIEKGEFVVFVGPSGCGKSTTLRMIAGLEEITAGELYIDGVLANNLDPKRRGIAMVFQNYALYPHMTVRQNLGFSLKMNKEPKEEIAEKVTEVASILGLQEYLDKKPGELSGGQRQRVALGRALIRDPKVFLMDEPLSNLDAKLRVSMREEITAIHKRAKATTIYVTHDQTEAMTMADKIVVMKDGFIQQIGDPMEIYSNPSNLFVASFIGTPSMNMFDVVLNQDSIEFDGAAIPFENEYFRKYNDFCKKAIAETEADIEELEELISKRPKKKTNKFLAAFRKKKKKNARPNPLSYEQQLLRKQEELDKLKAAVGSYGKNIVLGIRSTDLYLKDELGKGRYSSCIRTKVENIEILGHDLMIKASYQGQKIFISKPAKGFDVSQEYLDVYLDFDSVYFFDKITGKRIY